MREVIFLYCSLILVSLLLAGCGMSLQEASLNKPITIEGSKLSPLMGEKKPEGEIELTFKSVEKAKTVEDQFTGEGTIEAQGQFVIVYYTVQNEMKASLQPATQINEYLLLKDDNGREWGCVDYTGSYGGMSGNFAVLKDMEQPATKVSPGFSSDTAVVFDVPNDAKGLTLVSDMLGFELSLDKQE